MLACKRILAVLTLLVSTPVLLAALLAGVGVWFVWGAVTTGTTRVFGRIESALDRADGALDQVRKSLDRAQERLASARKENRELRSEPKPKLSARKAVAVTLQRQFAPELDTALAKLGTVAEASVVVNSVLQDIGEMSASGLDHERLTEVNRRLAKIGPAAWELSQLLGDPDSKADADGHFSRIEEDLRSFGDTLAEYEGKLRDARARTDRVKERVDWWTTFTVVAGSALCFWIALSQVSLVSHACSWAKRHPV